MRAALTKSAIGAFAEALKGEGAGQTAARLQALMAIFDGMAKRPLDDLLRLLDEVPSEQSEAFGEPTDVARTVASLARLERIMAETSTRGRLDDLVAFRTKLQRHESASIGSLIEAVRVLRRGRRGGGSVGSTDYARLAEELKAALGHDDKFGPLFEQLSGLDAAGVASVADILMSSGTSKSRRRDLDRIRERHEAQRALLAKKRAMAGRSAA